MRLLKHILKDKEEKTITCIPVWFTNMNSIENKKKKKTFAFFLHFLSEVFCQYVCSIRMLPKTCATVYTLNPNVLF